MSFLAGIVASLIEWLVSKLADLIGVDIRKAQADKKIVDTANQDAANLKGASSDADKDKALNSTINNVFK